jgi:hypothetical protein
MKNYSRVIPRDFFNEAKLMKCMGLLALKILDCQLPEGMKIVIEETKEPFNIVCSDSGYLSVTNYPVYINDSLMFFETIYNSKDNYPLICWYHDEEIRVFDESGEFTEEFAALKIN